MFKMFNNFVYEDFKFTISSQKYIFGNILE